MGETDATGTSRRKALWLLAAAAGLGTLGADSARQSAAPGKTTRPPVAAPRPRAVILPKPVPKPRPAPWTPVRLTAAKPKTPIKNLDELVPPPPPQSIALTIDDGPNPAITPQVLDLLAQHQIRATFFIIGEQVKEFPKLTRRIADAGHQVCNHTMSHPLGFEDLTAKRVRKEIAEAHDRIADLTGIVPVFFRAPGGGWSDAVLDVTAEYGMLPIDWAVDPQDWRRPGVGTIRRTLVGSEAGNILLCHDGGGDRTQTLKALRQAIPQLKRRGLSFVAL
ncbi:polysaccharide deacetylase family protein [Spirillospora sp. CA-294931]|uniref:polysaccharide deacetylase family protein n=1 Tax=Spirillospora sp. CA-294931 TaxID=3240042 RepID=UPI003D8A643E